MCLHSIFGGWLVVTLIVDAYGQVTKICKDGSNLRSFESAICNLWSETALSTVIYA